MMDNFHELTRQLLRFTEVDDLSPLLAAMAFGFTTVAGIVLRLFRARAVRRIQAVAAAYADREMAQHRRFHASSVRLVCQPDRAGCLVSFIDPTQNTQT